MKRTYVTYEALTIRAIQWFSKWKKTKEANGIASKDDEFRTITIYESSGREDKVVSLLARIDYCKVGERYKSILVAVSCDGSVSFEGEEK